MALGCWDPAQAERGPQNCHHQGWGGWLSSTVRQPPPVSRGYQVLPRTVVKDDPLSPLLQQGWVDEGLRECNGLEETKMGAPPVKRGH